jgi:release factor glutamine methyltransferase
MRLSVPSRSLVAGRLRAAGCVFAEDEARLLIAAAGSAANLERMLDLRTAGRPLEYILGWAEFCGLRIAVEPDVFVPRRRTGLLVRQAAALVGPGAVVVDLCCGSGAVGAALAARVEGIELHAADVDPAAVRCARRNVSPAGGRVHEGDLYQALPSRLRGQVSALVVNAPYVPTGEIGLMPPEARVHEPRASLDGGPDGLQVQRRVVAGAPAWLAPGGHLLIETSAHQVPETAAMFVRSKLVPRVARDTELDATVVIGMLSPAGIY